MDKDELEQYYSRLFEDNAPSNNTAKTQARSKNTYSKSKPKLNIGDDVHDILTQRKKHRDILLIFLVCLTIYFAVGFTVLIIVKLIYQSITNTELISDTVLNIIGVSLFAEVITVIHSISKALWDENAVLPSLVQQLKDKDEEK